MTLPSQQEVTDPVATKRYSGGQVVPQVANPEALALANLKPIPTVWGIEKGRPIYDRLPAVSQQYQRFYDRDQVYVYIEPQTGNSVGVGSMNVTKTPDAETLLVANGTITWFYGQVPTSALVIDITELNGGIGLDVGKYQVGYELKYEIPDNSSSLVPGYVKATCESSVLGEAALRFASNELVFQHRPYEALTEAAIGGSWWPSETALSGPYLDGSWYVLDMMAPVKAEVIEVINDPTLATSGTAKCAVYRSTDAIVWEKEGQAELQNDRWTFALGSKEYRYWKFYFFDGYGGINEIRWTGEAYFREKRVLTPISTAEPFLRGLYEEVPGDYCLLATFDVMPGGTIGAIQDQRRLTREKYEPVSLWLTSFEDTNIRAMFTDVEEYSTLYMAPMTEAKNIYLEMDDSVRFGPGLIDIGTEGWDDDIDFPVAVNITNSVETVVDDPNIVTSPIENDLAIDPVIGGDYIDLLASGSFSLGGLGISPKEIENLATPTFDSSVSNLAYAEDVLNNSWSIDDGTY